VDVFNGGAGDDSLVAGWSSEWHNGPWRIDGGEGYDTLSVQGYQPGSDNVVVLHNWNGIEHLIGTQGSDILVMDVTYDVTIEGGAGDDDIHDGHGNDVVFGGAGDDVLWGGMGEDTLRGYGNDVLNGGDGNDYLYADGGTSTMWGGLGSDTFRLDRFPVSQSQIMDFEGAGSAVGDLIEVGAYDPNLTFADFMANHARQVGSDTHLSLGSSLLILTGINKGSLIEYDFAFV